MPGKTMIEGTVYDIGFGGGGKTMVGGTAYMLSSGKTMVGGTAYNIKLFPTLAELFDRNNMLDGSYNSRNNAATGSLTKSYPSGGSAGETWYMFCGVGGSLEISRVDLLTSTTMSKTTTFGTWVSSGSTQRNTTLNSAGTQFSVSSVYSGVIAMYHFNYAPEVIDYMLSHINVTDLQEYYSSSTTSTVANLGVAASAMPTGGGVMYAMFRPSSPSGSCIGFIDPAYPLQVINGYAAAALTTSDHLLLTTTSSGTTYYMPTGNTTSVAVVRSYTFKYLTENW